MPSRAEAEAQKEKGIYDAIHSLERRLDKALFILNIIVWAAGVAGSATIVVLVNYWLKK